MPIYLVTFLCSVSFVTVSTVLLLHRPGKPLGWTIAIGLMVGALLHMLWVSRLLG